MTIRPFVRWPDSRLRTPAADVTEITDGVREIWLDMIDSMLAMPGGGGVGLAAPQIGVMLRLAVVDAGAKGEQVIRLANPAIISASRDLRPYQEGSPNLPGVWAEIARPAQVTVNYLDETGSEIVREFAGLEATSVQHQIDHLAGKMFFDRLSRTRRDMLLKKARKAHR